MYSPHPQESGSHDMGRKQSVCGLRSLVSNRGRGAQLANCLLAPFAAPHSPPIIIERRGRPFRRDCIRDGPWAQPMCPQRWRREAATPAGLLPRPRATFLHHRRGFHCVGHARADGGARRARGFNPAVTRFSSAPTSSALRALGVHTSVGRLR